MGHAAEERDLLSRYLEPYRRKSFDDLRALIGLIDAREIVGPSGRLYNLEIETRWDGRLGGPIRVIGSIDNGSLQNTIVPLCEDFLIAPPDR